MSARDEINRATRRAADRDRKRQPRMKVTGKGVFALTKLLRKHK